MSFFAVLFALLIEQLKPLPRDNAVHRLLARWVRWNGRNFDAGERHHAAVVWAVSVVLPSVAMAALYLLVRHHSLLLALALDVAVLYLCLGFRQFSHFFTAIRAALDRGDEAQARALLAQWQQLDAAELPRHEVLRHVVEHALLAAHRHVFGVFFCFVLFSALGLGPLGAVAYRLAEFSARHWNLRGRHWPAPLNPGLAGLSRRLFTLIDHVPARLTAGGFAVVGNFEESVAAWRRDATLWRHANEGVILSSAAGALGVQLGGAAAAAASPVEPGARNAHHLSSAPDGDLADALGSTVGTPLQAAHLHSVVGLVWRSVVLWMLLLALLTVANVVG